MLAVNYHRATYLVLVCLRVCVGVGTLVLCSLPFGRKGPTVDIGRPPAYVEGNRCTTRECVMRKTIGYPRRKPSKPHLLRNAIYLA